MYSLLNRSKTNIEHKINNTIEVFEGAGVDAGWFKFLTGLVLVTLLELFETLVSILLLSAGVSVVELIWFPSFALVASPLIGDVDSFLF